MNTSNTTLYSQRQGNRPDTGREWLRDSSAINSPECGFDGPAHIIDTWTFFSDQQGTPFVSVVINLGSLREQHCSEFRPLVDDGVVYSIHVLLTPKFSWMPRTYSYEFRFRTRFTNQDWILKTFLGMVEEGEEVSHDLGQTYTVTRVDRLGRTQRLRTVLGTGRTFPHEMGICELEDEHRAFVGLWDHSLDIDAPVNPLPFRTQISGQDVHNEQTQPVIVLQIPTALFRGEQHLDVIYATKYSQNRRRRLLHQTSPAGLSGKHTRTEQLYNNTL